MNVAEIIASLEAERAKIDATLVYLRDLEDSHPSSIGGVLNRPHRKRGRKGMSPNEREEVSRRMKKYWASQRKLRKNGNAEAVA